MRDALRPHLALPLHPLLALLGTLALIAFLAAPAAAAPGDTVSAGSGERFAVVSVDTLTPTMVTTTSGPDLTIDGHIRNTSSRTLRDLTLRLERGNAVTSAAGLRTSLAIAHPPIAVASPFRSVVDELKPGAQVSFSIRMPLSGDGGLQLARTGVYPLQVNINAVPDYGSMAQVAGSRTLLPVLSLPPNADRAAEYAATSDGAPTAPGVGDGSPVTGLGADGSISADISSPSRLTMLWPLAAPPQLAPGGLGAQTEPVRLISEDMARSLQSGRLHNLLDTVRGFGDQDAGSTPTSETPGPDDGSSTPSPDTSPTPDAAAPAPPSDLQRSICLAVDPDLLVTVRAMSLGYVVTTDPADPTARTVPGTGQDAAAAWLTELQAVAQRMCVVALPFGQADLTSLHQVDSAGLTAAALDSPADVVDAILGIRSQRGLTIPPLGALDRSGAAVLQSSAHTSVLAAATTVGPVGSPAASGAYRVGALSAQTFDEPVTEAFGALGTQPVVPGLTPPDQQVDLAAESPVSRRQAALGALAYASIGTSPDSTAGAESGGTTGRAQVIMPPTYWSPTADDAAAVFDTATVLLGSKAAVATPVSAVTAALTTPGGPARLIDPPGVGPVTDLGPNLPTALADRIRGAAELSWRLQGSLVDSADTDATPERYLAPLREDLLRAIRLPDQNDDAKRAAAAAQRQQRVSAVESTLERMRSEVSILDPGGRYTLASERSPLLLVVRNDLSLPVRVRISSTAPSDLSIGDVGVVEIPARGTRQIQLPTHAQSSESTSVHITLATATGIDLGSPITLSVYSNAYGKPLFIITLVAGVILVLLTARRLWHRFRGEPDPADADRPEPDEVERLLASSTYQQRRRTLQQEGPFEDHPPRQRPPAEASDPTGADIPATTNTPATDNTTATDNIPATDNTTGTDRTGA